MVQAWWAAGLALPAILVRSTLNPNKKAKTEEDAVDVRLANLPLTRYEKEKD